MVMRDAITRLSHSQAALVTEQLPFQAVVLRLQGADLPPDIHIAEKRTL